MLSFTKTGTKHTTRRSLPPPSFEIGRERKELERRAKGTKAADPVVVATA